jgi:hypothetical protein
MKSGTSFDGNWGLTLALVKYGNYRVVCIVNCRNKNNCFLSRIWDHCKGSIVFCRYAVLDSTQYANSTIHSDDNSLRCRHILQRTIQDVLVEMKKDLFVNAANASAAFTKYLPHDDIHQSVMAMSSLKNVCIVRWNARSLTCSY